jgi:hypothetical protein
MKIKVTGQTSKVVSVNTQGTTEVVAVGVQGPSGPNYVNTAGDVDVSNLENGSVLVYKSSSLKWTATRTLEGQNLEGGHY